MKESKQVPGIFFYNRHPIRQVDVLGTVVLSKERDAFHTYGDYDSHPGSSSSLDLVEQMRKLQEVIWLKSRLDIGDVVRVRGFIKIYRQKREISASMYYKVNDPIYDAQISRMLELPHLYREIYDKKFQLPEETQSGQGSAAVLNSITLLSEKIMDFLLRSKTQNFYQQELETVNSLVSLIRPCGSKATSEQELELISAIETALDPLVHFFHIKNESVCHEMDFKVGLNAKLIRSSFIEAIKVLQEKGALFQKSKNPNGVYCVTKQDKELYRVTLEIIKADCKRPKWSDQTQICLIWEKMLHHMSADHTLNVKSDI
uniref:Uncharacterized protein n=1 Tax=Sphaerodactylus townsendi TaxID=933632 RepID=A0ACB8FA10_9SAUR